jgi:hypothetical protein
MIVCFGLTQDLARIRKKAQLCFFVEERVGFRGGNFLLGGRNSHDRSLALGITAGYRVFVCENGAFSGDYTPVMRKHTRNFNLNNVLSVGIGNILRNFEPMVQDIQRWRETMITDVNAKLCIYEAFVEEATDLPKHLMRPTHDLYFHPQHEEFPPGNVWSLQNAFTGAIKTLDPIPQQRAVVNIGEYFQKHKL